MKLKWVIRALLSLTRLSRTQERLCMDWVRSSLSMRCMLLGYSFNPRLNGRVLGTAGSVTTIGLIKKNGCTHAKNQFDERKKNWLVEKSGLRRLHRPYAAADTDLQIRKGAGGDGHSDPEISGGWSQNFFSALWASLWSKNEGGGLGPPGPSPGSATVTWLRQSRPKRRQKMALLAGWSDW